MSEVQAKSWVLVHSSQRTCQERKPSQAESSRSHLVEHCCVALVPRLIGSHQLKVVVNDNGKSLLNKRTSVTLESDLGWRRALGVLLHEEVGLGHKDRFKQAHRDLQEEAREQSGGG